MSAPPHPALADRSAQYFGKCWNSPDAPDFSLYESGLPVLPVSQAITLIAVSTWSAEKYVSISGRQCSTDPDQVENALVVV